MLPFVGFMNFKINRSSVLFPQPFSPTIDTYSPSRISRLMPSKCGPGNQTNMAGENKVKVSVTFNAMKEFVEAVGKDKVEIATIIPDGMEPHDFEPKAQDLVGLSTAQIFVYNGFGMEVWVDDAIQAADNKNLITVEASDGATPIANTDSEEIEEHGQYDPHIWLSLQGAEIEVKNIKDALVEADAANKDYYQKNCDFC